MKKKRLPIETLLFLCAAKRSFGLDIKPKDCIYLLYASLSLRLKLNADAVGVNVLPCISFQAFYQHCRKKARTDLQTLIETMKQFTTVTLDYMHIELIHARKTNFKLFDHILCHRKTKNISTEYANLI